MRIRKMGLVLALSATLAFSNFLFAQTADSQGMAKVEPAASTPDLSGLWTRLRDPSHSPINLDFGKSISPMTPWAEAKFKAANSVYRSSSPSTVLSDPIFSCYPPGVPRIYLLNFPVQIVQTPGQVIMLFEYDHFVRHIYTDRQNHPRDMKPTWMGDSIGKWEGDTLVVDTVGLNDKSWLDQVGHPHSDALHIVERLRRIDHETLQDDLTIDDPKAYKAPWTGQQLFKLRPGWHLREYICEDHMEEPNSR